MELAPTLTQLNDSFVTPRTRLTQRRASVEDVLSSLENETELSMCAAALSTEQPTASSDTAPGGGLMADTRPIVVDSVSDAIFLSNQEISEESASTCPKCPKTMRSALDGVRDNPGISQALHQLSLPHLARSMHASRAENGCLVQDDVKPPAETPIPTSLLKCDVVDHSLDLSSRLPVALEPETTSCFSWLASTLRCEHPICVSHGFCAFLLVRCVVK